jgi:opacity protein-like surface antigen
MKKLSLVATALFTLVLMSGAFATAQAQVSFGPHLGAHLDAEELHIGANVRIPIGTPVGGSRFQLNPGFEFYPFMESGLSMWQINMDAVYPFPTKVVEPYVGAGLAVTHVSVDIPGFGSASDTDAGLNLKGGVMFGVPGMPRPFAEGVIGVGGTTSDFMLRGGVYFTFGK